MNLSSYPAGPEAFLRIARNLLGEPAECREAMVAQWELFCKHSPGLTVTLTDHDLPYPDDEVGVAQMVFVTDAFVSRLRAGLTPDINHHASRLMPDGTWPLLTPAEIRAANSGSGLNGLVTHYICRTYPGDGSANRMLRGFLDRAFALMCRGWNLKRVLLRALGTEGYERLLRAGYSLVHGDTAVADDRESEPRADRRYLLEASRASSLAQEGTWASRLFEYTAPRFGFTPAEQELMRMALYGRSDRRAAWAMRVTPDTIKKRWQSVYARVSAVNPMILPLPRLRARGAEKRCLILDYVREHPEELRPHSVPASPYKGEPCTRIQ